MKKRALIALSILLFLSGCSYDAPQATTVQKFQPVAPIEQSVISNKTVGEKQTQVEQIQVEKKQETTVPLSNDNSYINIDGIEVHSPAFAPSIPPGASARCRDGSYSFSQHRRGTCSGHGGVEEWRSGCNTIILIIKYDQIKQERNKVGSKYICL